MKSENLNFDIFTPLRIGALALIACVSTPVLAQIMPTTEAQEAIIKTSLLTFNDANMSGNYAVLNALGSKPFRDGLTPDKLKAAFKDFNEKQIDISAIVSAKAVATKPTAIDGDGVMVSEGYFDTPKMRVTYTVKTLMSDGKWRLLGINVKTADPAK